MLQLAFIKAFLSESMNFSINYICNIELEVSFNVPLEFNLSWSWIQGAKLLSKD
jgi:hypothetical protein